jgi:mannose-6-phosphate isomerase-like protein (cupin superfamily)
MSYALIRKEEASEKLNDWSLPFKVQDDIQIMNKPEVHKKSGDLWFCMEGEPTFIIGGELENPWLKDGDENELRAETIKGGDEIVLRPGDWLWAPPGCPHQHGCKTKAKLMIIKIPVL